VDAEYTVVQPAIDYLVFKAFSKFNQSPRKLVVYGTVQAYLKDSFPTLIAAIEEAKKQGITMGVKLVRGAYIKVENRVVKSLFMPSPIHSSRMETQSCYDDCASFMLEKVATGEATLLLATHNLESGKLTLSPSFLSFITINFALID
jgi:proline dehydrogenase